MSKLFMLARMTIHDGALEPFRQTTAKAVQVAKEVSDGLDAYEWFLSDDGRECTVIEIYDGPEAQARHFQRVVVPHCSRLREFCSSQLSLGGDIPPEMLTQMRARLGDVPFFGPSIAGRLHSPADVRRLAKPVIAGVVIRRSVPSGVTKIVRELAEATTRELAFVEEIAAFEWLMNDDAQELAILGLSSDPGRLLEQAVDAMRALQWKDPVMRFDIDAVGIPASDVRGRFPGANFGRLGGTRFEGVL